MSQSLSEFADLYGPDPFKCSCGKEVICVPRKRDDQDDIWKYEQAVCTCGKMTPLPESYAVFGVEGAPLFVYPVCRK